VLPERRYSGLYHYQEAGWRRPTLTCSDVLASVVRRQ
jgi:hypothetical protein